jgi:hypothetical protein
MVDTTAERFSFLACSIGLWFRLKSEQWNTVRING